MADYVSVANLAVGFLGEDDQLRSPTDDTHVGRTVAAAWELTRQAALRDHPWNFALRRAQLAALAIDPFPGGGYSFQLPPDCMRLIDVPSCISRDHWRVEGRVILSYSTGPLQIRYIADVAEPALWDALFVEAFAMRLAFQIADRITGGRDRKLDAWNAYTAALKEAKRVDALENPRVEEAPSDWETARGDGRAAYWHDRHFSGYGPYTPA